LKRVDAVSEKKETPRVAEAECHTLVTKDCHTLVTKDYHTLVTKEDNLGDH
jgi:hypothetical protein